MRTVRAAGPIASRAAASITAILLHDLRHQLFGWLDSSSSITRMHRYVFAALRLRDDGGLLAAMNSALPPGGLAQSRRKILAFPGCIEIAAADLTVGGERPIELTAMLLW